MDEIHEARKKQLLHEIRILSLKLLAHMGDAGAFVGPMDKHEPGFILAIGDVEDVAGLVETYRKELGNG